MGRRDLLVAAQWARILGRLAWTGFIAGAFLALVVTLLTGCSTWCSQNPSECALAFQQGRAMTAPPPSTALPMCYEVEPYTRNVPCRQF